MLDKPYSSHVFPGYEWVNCPFSVMKNIIDKLTKTKYIGKWFTKEEEKKKLMIGDSIEGFTKLKFNRATELSTREEALAILISNYEDKYINHWLHHSSFILSKFSYNC